jgi:hypothetical protein
MNRIMFLNEEVVNRRMNHGLKSRPVHRGPTLVGSTELNGAEACRRCRAWLLAIEAWMAREWREELDGGLT